MVRKDQSLLTRRLVLLNAGVALGGALAAACGRVTVAAPAEKPQAEEKPAVQPAAKEVVTIQYGTHFNSRQQENAQEFIIAPFEAENPDITVEIVLKSHAYQEAFRTAFAAGVPPDLVWQADNSIFLQGFTVDLSGYVKRDNFDLSVFSQKIYSSIFQIAGATNGIPNQSGGNWPVMPYNREILLKAGLEEPPAEWGDASWTWDTFLGYLQKTTTTEGGAPATYGFAPMGACAIYGNQPYLWNAQWVTNDRTAVVCDTPEMIDCYETYFGLANEHRVMLKPGQGEEVFGTSRSRDLFVQGKLAFFQTAVGGLFAVLDAVKAGADLAYAPIPRDVNAGAFQFLGGNGVVDGAKHPDEGWLYAKWQGNTPNWAVSRGTTPPRSDLLETWIAEVYGDLGEQMRVQVLATSLENTTPYDPAWLLPFFGYCGSKLVREWATGVFAGTASVGDGLKDLKPQLQVLLDDEDDRFKGVA